MFTKQRLLQFPFHWIGLGVIIAIICQPLIGPPPKGDDILLHFYRIPEINALWGQGIWFTRWLPDLVFGYGSPLLNFYPPLSVYALTISYWLVGANAPAALNLVFAFGLATAVIGMFVLGRALFGEMGGLVTAAAYGFSPHLLYQVYNRGSLSNTLAMSFFPLAAWGLLQVIARPAPRRIVGAALLIAVVMLSHTAASLLFMGPLLVWGTAVLIAVKRDQEARHFRQHVKALAAAIAGGLAISAFNWLPALAEISLTRYAASISPEKVDFAAYFAPIWSWPDTVVAGSVNASLPPTVGLGQMVLGLAAVAAGLLPVRWWAQRRRPLPRQTFIVIIGGLIGLAGLFLAWPISAPIWRAVSPLRALQFPWRFLDIPAFFLSLACGHWVATDSRFTRLRAGLLGASLTLFVANAVPSLYPPQLNELPRRPSLADATAAQMKNFIYGLTAWGEYTSSAVTDWPPGPPFPGADTGSPLSAKLNHAALPSAALQAAAGTPWWADLHLVLPVTTGLTFDTHYFPGWSAKIDGRPVPIKPDDQGRLYLVVPAGDHQVRVAWGRTPIRWLADGMTVLGALFLLIIFFQRHWGKQLGDIPFLGLIPSSQSYPQLVLLLGVLAGVKFLVVDQMNTPLVSHLDEGRVPGLAQPAWHDFGGKLLLQGYDIRNPDQLLLYWQAEQTLEHRYQVQITLVNGRGEPERTLFNDTPGFSPTNTWEINQLVRDDYDLPISEEERPFVYRLRVGVTDMVTGTPLRLNDSPNSRFDEVEIGSIKIPPAETAVLPANAAHVGAVFGTAILLSQVSQTDAIGPDQSLDVTFVWESLHPVETDYTVFIHLLNPDGSLAAGSDTQPLAGLYPTSFWSLGERLVDHHTWQPNLPPGTYTLQIGLYDLATGQRLNVDGGTVTQLELGTIRVTQGED